jgi:hypothetical protein
VDEPLVTRSTNRSPTRTRSRKRQHVPVTRGLVQHDDVRELILPRHAPLRGRVDGVPSQGQGTPTGCCSVDATSSAAHVCVDVGSGVCVCVCVCVCVARRNRAIVQMFLLPLALCTPRASRITRHSLHLHHTLCTVLTHLCHSVTHFLPFSLLTLLTPRLLLSSLTSLIHCPF